MYLVWKHPDLHPKLEHTFQKRERFVNKKDKAKQYKSPLKKLRKLLLSSESEGLGMSAWCFVVRNNGKSMK